MSDSDAKQHLSSTDQQAGLSKIDFLVCIGVFAAFASLGVVLYDKLGRTSIESRVVYGWEASAPAGITITNGAIAPIPDDTFLRDQAQQAAMTMETFSESGAAAVYAFRVVPSGTCGASPFAPSDFDAVFASCQGPGCSATTGLRTTMEAQIEASAADMATACEEQTPWFVGAVDPSKLNDPSRAIIGSRPGMLGVFRGPGDATPGPY